MFFAFLARHASFLVIVSRIVLPRVPKSFSRASDHRTVVMLNGRALPAPPQDLVQNYTAAGEVHLLANAMDGRVTQYRVCRGALPVARPMCVDMGASCVLARVVSSVGKLICMSLR